MAKRKVKALPVQEVIRLDLGCGKNPREGFEGVDAMDFGQKNVFDLRGPWPWADNSVEEANCSHFIEHLTASERIHFVNELYRVLKPGARCSVVVPAWSSARAYGDLTHQWPPVSEWWFFYLNKTWRDANAPHNTDYRCNFDCTWGYGMHQAIQARNQEYQQHALTFFKEAAQDIIAAFVKN
jgi:SAM-dependent methyltransferase